MTILARSRQIGQAVKNVQRLRHILAVFMKHGFVDIIDRMNLGKFLSGRLATYAASQADKTFSERLRLAFEELGPTFVKLGQLLSTRADLLPEAFLEEFVKLQDHVQPLGFEIVKEIIEAELKTTLENSFSFFSFTPLAAGSIGQVHEATLKTGEQVVLKVQRPEIEKIIDTDISLLAFLAGLLEKYVPESQSIQPKLIVDEFFRTLSSELNYVIEANNTIKIRQNMSSLTDIVIPKVYQNLSTKKVLTLEKLPGVRIHDLEKLEALGTNRKEIVLLGAKAFFKSVMIDGLFHGDLHGGNLFILPENRLGIIDFGIVGRLSEKSRDQLAQMLLALLAEDYESLCYTYSELGACKGSIDFVGFQRDVRNALSPYMGVGLGKLNIGQLLIEATRIATRYEISTPRDWMLVFKSIFTIEGISRTLDPDFNLLNTSHLFIKDLLKNQYSFNRISKELMWVAKDTFSLIKDLPRQTKWMLRKLNSNDFAVEIKSADLESIRNELRENSARSSFSILVAGLFIASSIALQSTSEKMLGGYPLAAVFYFSAGCILFLAFLFKFLHK